MKKTNRAQKSKLASNTNIIETPVEKTAAEFPIVGIGASAGGLAAFEAFFSALPADKDTGMAFVLVQHLAPDHKSILAELVRRYTRMQVFEVEDGMTVRPNCTYIIPPGRDMAFLHGCLQLLEPVALRGQRLPIDFFFRSLAQDQRERAIGIVLSGTGSDGMLGVRAIKGEGGTVMAQNPESTEYDGMPRSAIATGLVDFILPPAEMPAQLITFAGHAFAQPPRPELAPGTTGLAPTFKTEDAFKKMFILLRSQTGHDFSQYKTNTITRRVERRLAVNQIKRLDDYIQFLRKTPSEVEALFRDLLIGVTSFFRDSEVFAELEKRIVPRLFSGNPAGPGARAAAALVRVWVAGCSTGEEAYSLAILLQERMETQKQSFKVQIFATDIDRRAIELARGGIYPASIAADVSPERLARFFTLEADGNAYRVNKSIRDLLVFSEQDVIKDPPFSKLDLISCRNLLIYMGGELQKKLIPLFHYALQPAGILLLGTSETVGDFPDLFTALDRTSKIYERKENLHPGQYPSIGKLLLARPDRDERQPPAGKLPAVSKNRFADLATQALLEHCAAAAALISVTGDILYLHGRTGLYLEPAPGNAELNILKMAREGLRRELAAALHKAVKLKEPVAQANVRVKTNGAFTVVNLTVRPVHASTTVEPDLYLVILEETTAGEPIKTIAADSAAAGDDSDDRIAALKQELRAKEEYLQSTNEELETANEELKSSNEEMQSVNEELQSTNEELATVNAELQTKVTDLTRINNDMNNLLAGTGIGTIFVDHQLRIRRFTPAAVAVTNLILTDVGRPLGHIVSNLVGYDRLEADVRSVLETLQPREIEVRIKAGAWFLLRIRPYRTLENVIEGAVIMYFDITEMKRVQQALSETEAKLTAAKPEAQRKVND